MHVVLCHFLICVDWWSHHCIIQDIELFYHHEDLPHVLPSLSYWPGSSPLFFISVIVSFWECSVNRFIDYATFWVWLVYNHHIAFQVHPGTWVCLYLLFYCYMVFHGMDVPQFQYWSNEEHYDYFQFLTITNKAAINNHAQGFVLAKTCFFRVNAQECSCWLVWLVCISFFKKVPISRVLVPFHSPTSSIGEIHLLCLLPAFGVVMFLFWLVSHYGLNLRSING